MYRITRVAILADFPVDTLHGVPQGRAAGHGATWLPQLAQEFSNRSDLEISWIVMSKHLKKTKISKFFGQAFYEIPKGFMTLDIILRHRIAKIKLQKIIDLITPDVIHVWGSEKSYASVLKGARVPTILSMQGVLSEYQRIGSFRKNWRMRQQASYEKSWVKQASVVTTESEWGRERIREIEPSLDIRLVEYGVNQRFYNMTWTPDPSNPVVLYSGGEDWRKGFDILKQAIEMQPSPSWKCWIAGSISDLSTEWTKYPECIEILGNLSWDDLQSRMQKAWALVLPTRADTSPNAVKEARVMGLPVITSSHGGQSGYIRHEENGIIVNPLTPAGLRRAIDRLMSDYSLTKKMGRTRHLEDREYFIPRHTAGGFTELYKELTNKNTSHLN